LMARLGMAPEREFSAKSGHLRAIVNIRRSLCPSKQTWSGVYIGGFGLRSIEFGVFRFSFWRLGGAQENESPSCASAVGRLPRKKPPAIRTCKPKCPRFENEKTRPQHRSPRSGHYISRQLRQPRCLADLVSAGALKIGFWFFKSQSGFEK
jgi:hypothetical protein